MANIKDPNLSIKFQDFSSFPFPPLPLTTPPDFTRPYPFFASNSLSRPPSGYSTAVDHSGDDSPLKKFKSNGPKTPNIKGPHSLAKERGGSGDSAIETQPDHVELSGAQRKAEQILRRNYASPASSSSTAGKIRVQRSNSAPIPGQQPLTPTTFTSTSNVDQNPATTLPRPSPSHSIPKFTIYNPTSVNNPSLDSIYHTIEASTATKRQSILENHLDKIWKIVPPEPELAETEEERAQKKRYEWNYREWKKGKKEDEWKGECALTGAFWVGASKAVGRKLRRGFGSRKENNDRIV